MKRQLMFFAFTLLFVLSASGQRYGKVSNVSYNYFSSPGFVNITEVTGAMGLGDTGVDNSSYYGGVTNIFGYQIDRNFIGGAGLGFYVFDNSNLIPLFLEFRYTGFMKVANPFLFADGGVLFDYSDLNHGSKIFINPGAGISRSLSSHFDWTLGAGLMIQMGDGVPRASFLNVKLGLIFRKNSARMRKPSGNLKDYCPY